MVWQQHSCHSMGVTLCPAASVPCQQSRAGLSTAQHHAALASCSPRLQSQQLSSEQPFVPHGPSGSGSPHPASLESMGLWL